MRNLIRTVLGVLLTAVGLIGPARAASFEVFPGKDDLPPLVLVAGQFVLDDAARFAAAITGMSRAVVAFDSPGGHLLAGIEIGKTIRMRGFPTIVFDDATCNSACALAWLGGPTRYVLAGGSVGFHAASITEAGITREVGAGNALVGAYLTNLGLSEGAIFALTITPPDQITVLTPRLANDLGIDVAYLPGDAGAATQAGTARNNSTTAQAAVVAKPPTLVRPGVGSDLLPAADTRSLERAAATFAAQFLSVAVSHVRSDTGAFVAAFYDDRVSYYGGTLQRNEVIGRIDAYIDRWPRRAIALGADPTVSCVSDTCVVIANGEYLAESPERNSRFLASLSYRLTVRRTPTHFVVTGETNEVLAKSTGPIDQRAARVAGALQQELQRHRCDPGPVDGVWGAASERALGRFNAASGTRLPVQAATEEALRIARSVGGTACRRPRPARTAQARPDTCAQNFLRCGGVR